MRPHTLFTPLRAKAPTRLRLPCTQVRLKDHDTLPAFALAKPPRLVPNVVPLGFLDNSQPAIYIADFIYFRLLGENDIFYLPDKYNYINYSY